MTPFWHRRWIACLALVGWACSTPPPLPEVDLGAFAAPVQQQIQESRQAVDERPDDANCNGMLAMRYHVYQLDAAALVAYQRARLLDPRDPRWSYFPALILQRLQRWPEAETLYQDS